MARAWAGCAIWVTAVVLAGAAHGQPRPSVVTNPDWIERPDAEALARVYPAIAQLLGLEGRATISCSINAAGVLHACSAVSEQPTGLGFGAATVEAAALFRMKPKTVDGTPVAGGTVRIPIRYTLPRSQAPDTPPEAPAAPPALTAETAALAKVLERAFTAKAESSVTRMIALDRKVTDEKVRADARKAMASAATKFAVPYAASTAAHYAAGGDAASVQAMTTFLSSPASLAMENARRDAEHLVAQLGVTVVAEMSAIARAKFCESKRCDVARPELAGVIAPNFSKTPTPQEIRRATPPLTQALGVAGWARLNCIVIKGGGVSYCALVGEAPAGLGLGTSARNLADAYRVETRSGDKDLEGETVTLVVDFPTPPAPQPDPAWRSPGPADPTMLALARKLVALEDHERQADEVRKALDRFAAATPPDQAGLLAAYRFAFEEIVRRYVERMAVAYALAYARPDLEAVVAHLSGPASELRRGASTRQAALEASEAYYRAVFAAEAARVFCEVRDCVAPVQAAGAPATGGSRN
ncbi:energy transducer TonB [Phenylobacterium sp.]|uniref:energy transducer TonB n=1 Tax=Phenylobacterium sp. TaxID=1871053 RepID=UPI002FCB01C9